MSCDYDLSRYDGNGSATWYYFGQGSTEVNCSYAITDRGQYPWSDGRVDRVANISTGDGTYFIAMNTADYASAATCGACVEVTYGQRKVVATVVDQCPTGSNPLCQAGHLDLSQKAFEQLEPNLMSNGHLQNLSWRFVPCPTTSNLSFKLKEPSNAGWNEILVQNHRHPIAKVEANVNGSWRSGTRQAYNYWNINGGSLGSAPYQIRVTDRLGQTITASLPLASGDLAGNASPGQFPGCQ